MAARPSTLNEKCAEPGCGERHLVAFDSQRDRREYHERHRNDPAWKCLSHAYPDRTLTPDNPVVTTQLVAADRYTTTIDRGTFYAPKEPTEVRKHLGVFWVKPGEEENERGGNGFAHGFGAYAYADKWPPGTKLYVTVYAETPEQAEATGSAL